MVKPASLRRRHRRYKTSGPAPTSPWSREPDCKDLVRMLGLRALYLRPNPAAPRDSVEYGALTRDLDNRIEKHRRECPTCRGPQGPLDAI